MRAPRRVFGSIEEFMKTESEVTGRAKRAFRNAFAVPKLVEHLGDELDKEIQVFTASASVDDDCG